MESGYQWHAVIYKFKIKESILHQGSFIKPQCSQIVQPQQATLYPMSTTKYLQK